MKTAIAFDFDGVLLDSKEGVYTALQRFFQDRGHPFSENKFQQLFVGNLWENFYREGFDEQDKHTYFEDYCLPLTRQCHFFKEASDIVRAARKNADLYIISSHHSSFIAKKLQEEGIESYFEEIRGSDSPGNKTDYLRILAGNYQSVVFVGDTAGDVEEAKKADVTSVAVTWGFHGEILLSEASPDFIVSNTIELIDVLSKF